MNLTYFKSMLMDTILENPDSMEVKKIMEKIE
jgi:hypothetical protein